jgi:predicted HAD superfamily phosphohydrolase YqeG
MSTSVTQNPPKKRLTIAELEFLDKNLDHMGESELRTWFKDLDTTVVDEEQDSAQEHFMAFVKKAWPTFN